MDLKAPLVAYIAESDIEASQVAQLLVENDVPAHAEEDVSVVGLWAFGKLSQIHKPRVWIATADKDRAFGLLSDYEREKVSRTQKSRAGDADSIAVACEDCGKSTDFPARFIGTVQECRHCRAHVDVGEFDWPYDDPETAETDTL